MKITNSRTERPHSQSRRAVTVAIARRDDGLGVGQWSRSGRVVDSGGGAPQRRSGRLPFSAKCRALFQNSLKHLACSIADQLFRGTLDASLARETNRQPFSGRARPSETIDWIPISVRRNLTQGRSFLDPLGSC